MNCTASVTSERCDVWAPTQNQGGVQAWPRRSRGSSPSRSSSTRPTSAAGSAGASRPTSSRRRCAIAKAAGKPVKVIWTREEDIQNDFYRPANYTKIEAGLDDKGKVTAWSHKIVCPSIFARVFPSMMKNGIDNAAVEGVADLEYEVPNLLAEYVRIDLPVPVGFWRSVGASHNGFVIESFIDELAAAAKKDPLEFRLGLLQKHPRAKRVLETAAKKAGWGKTAETRPGARHCLSSLFRDLRCPGGRGLGGQGDGQDQGAQGHLRRGLRVGHQFRHRGRPDGGSHQSWVCPLRLRRRWSSQNGGVKTTNFGDYDLLRMSEIARDRRTHRDRQGPARRDRRTGRAAHRAGRGERGLRGDGRPASEPADDAGGRIGGDEGMKQSTVVIGSTVGSYLTAD